MAPLTTWFASLLVAASTVHAGITLPAKMPAGIYTTTFDSNGMAVHTKVGDIDASIHAREPFAPGRYALARRGERDDGVHCAKGNTNLFTMASTTTAVSNLGAACDKGGEAFVPKAKMQDRTKKLAGATWALANGHIAYVCNYSLERAQHCRSDELKSDSREIRTRCPTRPGWVTHNPWLKNYGVTGSRETFC